MSESKWFVVIPPSGAARVVAQHTANNFIEKTGARNVKIFDTLIYQNSFQTLLKNPDETLVVDLINQSLIVSCLDFGTTHFFSGALSPVSLFSLEILKKQHIKTIHWFYEDFNRATYWKSILQGYTVFLSIQEGPFPEICNKHQVQWHLLPTAASIPQPDGLNDERRLFDVAFIGIPSSYRIKVLEQLARSGLRCIIAGSGWEQYSGPLQPGIISAKWVNEHQSAHVLSRAKIGLNLSINDPEGVNDVHLSPRVFDILRSGALLLTEETPLSHEIMRELRFETFSSPGQIETVINSILLSFAAYESDRLKNLQTVNTFHTYSNRVKQIITLVE
ncbi:MAG: glycosyltransferase family 1 protein [Chitinispirillaceae bacterium]|nr:glycosyltransferase family 1 protein [Chitinispirillaceae bacterium]